MKSSRKKITKQATPGYPIYPEKGPDTAMGKYLSNGKWVKGNPERDANIRNYTQFIEQGQKSLNASPVITVDPETYISYAQQKEDQMDRENFLSLASLLIDPKNPETQKDAYSVVPELRDIPESYYKDQVALSMTIHSMLRDGQIRGREDFDLLYFILGPDFQFPMFPLWDPSGTLIGQLKDTQEYQDWLKLTLKNIWNPVTRAYEADGVAQRYANPKLNNKIKLIIAKRMLPALRNLDDTKAIEALEKILEGKTQSATFWQANGRPTDRIYNSFKN